MARKKKELVEDGEKLRGISAWVTQEVFDYMSQYVKQSFISEAINEKIAREKKEVSE